MIRLELGNRGRYLTVRLSDLTFLNLYSPLDWFFRIRGHGLSLSDHRRMPMLFSERYGMMSPRPRHFGPFCLRRLTPKEHS